MRVSIGGAVCSGLICSSLTQLIQARVREKWRKLTALLIAVVVSLAGAGVVWGMGGSYTWPALVSQVLAALGVAQAVYAVVKPIVPGAQNVDVTSLLSHLEELEKTVASLSDSVSAGRTDATDKICARGEVSATDTSSTASVAQGNS